MRTTETIYFTGAKSIKHWEPVDTFCPTCGTQGSVFQDQSDGDYYHGSPMVCTFCDYSFHITCDQINPEIGKKIREAKDENA